MDDLVSCWETLTKAGSLSSSFHQNKFQMEPTVKVKNKTEKVLE
jgi:hypothetical protein